MRTLTQQDWSPLNLRLWTKGKNSWDPETQAMSSCVLGGGVAPFYLISWLYPAESQEKPPWNLTSLYYSSAHRTY